MAQRVNRNIGALAGVLAFLIWLPPAASQSTSWVKTGVTGRLIYVPDAEGDRIADFSMVGYGAGKRNIPDDLPVLTHIDPVAGDNTQHIQNAINFASTRPLQANGFRGIVELGPGKYNVDGHVSITTSGVVLRGAGGGDDLASNTHIVSQNRTDSIVTSASTPVISIQGPSTGTTRGPQIAIADKRVPVGAKSFRVASTAGMAVGGMIEIFRPSTQAWIEELGMHLMPAPDAWEAGDQELRWHRTITRIEGDRIFVDAPITTALDTQWGGGTVRTYSAPNVIRNVGVENLRGQSLDVREELNEQRTPTFVRFSRAADGWVRDVETRHFSYASVYALEADGTQHITVDNVHSRLPSGEVTGGRRYTFAMDAQNSLVKNSSADSGRHDFVTGSAVTGPIVFYNSTSTNTRGDAGPHHRWGNGLLLDNIDVNGNAINVQNRWTSGSGHGWSGANVVIWNSEANSFIVQNTPTAQNWLIGSNGAINPGDCHLGGASCAGFHESHGTRVTLGGEQSLYEAQLNDAEDIREFHWTGGSGNWDDHTKWDQNVKPGVYSVSTRDYVTGDFDNYTYDPSRNSLDEPYILPGWQADIAASSSNPIAGLDTPGANQNVAFTTLQQLSAGERVIHGYLAMSLKQTGDEVAGDFVQLFDMEPSHRFEFNALGWASRINSTTPFVGVIDLGAHLDKLQTGTVNVQVNDDTAIDWAMHTVTVATPKSDPLGPSVFLDGGNVVISSIVPAVANIQNGGIAASQLTLARTGRLSVTQNFEQTANSTLIVEVGGANLGQFGKVSVGDHALLAGALQLRLTNGFRPAIGTQFEIVSAAGGLLGTTFSATPVFNDLSGSALWQLVYEPGAVKAEVVSDSFFGDLNRDGLLTGADWTVYIGGALADLSALSASEAYFHGDLNSDGVNDIFDMALFIETYEAVNGAGAFGRMLENVPETSSVFLLLIGAYTAYARSPRPCR